MISMKVCLNSKLYYDFCFNFSRNIQSLQDAKKRNNIKRIVIFWPNSRMIRKGIIVTWKESCPMFLCCIFFLWSGTMKRAVQCPLPELVLDSMEQYPIRVFFLLTPRLTSLHHNMLQYWHWILENWASPDRLLPKSILPEHICNCI